jgi:hypothetical protein
MTNDIPQDGGRGAGSSIKTYVLRSAPYLAMLVLAIAAIAYTDTSPESSFTLWQLVAPVFALICIGTQWRRTEATTAARARLVGMQALHWGALWLSMQVLRLPLFSVVMTADSLGIAALLLLSLSTMMAGIYLNWRFFVVGAFMLGGLIVVGYLEETALMFALLALAGVALLLAGHWLLDKWRFGGATPSA